MPDFERIDRELAAIGAVPEAVQPLLDQYGQRDRSLENVDVVLGALREGRDPASTPPEPEAPRPSFLPLGWDAERKSEPGLEPAPMPAAAAIPREQEEITVTTGVPDEMPVADSEPPPEPEPAPVMATAVSPLARPSMIEAFTESEPPPVAVSAAPDEASEPIDTQESFPPPPPDDPPAQVVAAVAAHEPEAEAKVVHRSSRPPRPDLKALLDTELDPSEFPSTNPPPLRPRSAPPGASLPPPLPPRSSLAPNEAPAQEPDFELLVDDDDIMEIDEESE